LINSVLSRVAEARRETVKEAIDDVDSLLNRGEDRLPAIEEFEADLNDSIQEVSDVELEIAMDIPELDDLLETAEVYARDGTRTPIEAKGHGLQRSTIFTILRVYSNFATQEEEASKSTIFAFEEPEIYQHPQSQRTLLSVFRDIADSGDQILYTTHSSHFVNVSRFDEVCIMRKEGTEADFRTEPTQIRMETVLEDLQRRHGKGTPDGIRNQYENAFDARISEGFFADKVILVEGESEKYILPIYARLLGYDFDRNNIAVVYPGTGKGQLDRLIRIFAGFDIPTYPIFDDDGDVGSKTVEIADLMGKDLSGVDSIETTIGDRLTIFEGELEDALQDEIDEYQEWWDEASKAWGECGKPLKHRYMAVQIENKIKDGANLEEVIPQTMQRIIQKVRDLSTAVNVFEGEVGERSVATFES
jgi:predicted ATP-dependent endonuclease of OLD family